MKELKKDDLDIEESDLLKFIRDFQKDKTIVEFDGISKTHLVFFDEKPFEEMSTDHLNAPTNLSIYITQKCTKACRHCVSDSTPSAHTEDELKKDQWIPVLKHLRAAGITTLVFSGGEPLTKEGIFDILQEADKLNFSIILLTDFDDISQEHIDKIKSIRNLEDLQVSLDGASAEIHDWIRGVGSFEKSMRRMRMLRESGVVYTISSVIHKNNLNQIEDMARLGNEL